MDMESEDMFYDPDDDDMTGEAADDSDYVPSQDQEQIIKAFQDFVQETGNLI